MQTHSAIARPAPWLFAAAYALHLLDEAAVSGGLARWSTERGFHFTIENWLLANAITIVLLVTALLPGEPGHLASLDPAGDLGAPGPARDHPRGRIALVGVAVAGNDHRTVRFAAARALVLPLGAAQRRASHDRRCGARRRCDASGTLGPARAPAVRAPGLVDLAPMRRSTESRARRFGARHCGERFAKTRRG